MDSTKLISLSLWQGITKALNQPAHVLSLIYDLIVPIQQIQGFFFHPIHFALYVNDLEQELLKVQMVLTLVYLNFFLLLNADGIIFSENASGLQNGLNILHNYCQKCKLTVNVNKSKVTVFRKRGRLAQNLVIQEWRHKFRNCQ